MEDAVSIVNCFTAEEFKTIFSNILRLERKIQIAKNLSHSQLKRFVLSLKRSEVSIVLEKKYLCFTDNPGLFALLAERSRGELEIAENVTGNRKSFDSVAGLAVSRRRRIRRVLEGR